MLTLRKLSDSCFDLVVDGESVACQALPPKESNDKKASLRKRQSSTATDDEEVQAQTQLGALTLKGL